VTGIRIKGKISHKPHVRGKFFDARERFEDKGAVFQGLGPYLIAKFGRNHRKEKDCADAKGAGARQRFVKFLKGIAPHARHGRNSWGCVFFPDKKGPYKVLVAKGRLCH
jgi:hypothetical protein